MREWMENMIVGLAFVVLIVVMVLAVATDLGAS